MTDYFVRSPQVHPTNGDGRTHAAAFSGFANVSTTLLQPGDELYVCGLLDTDFWNSRYVLESSGTENNHVVIRGDWPGDPGEMFATYLKIPAGSGTWVDYGAWGAWSHDGASSSMAKTLFEDHKYMPGYKTDFPDATWSPGDFYHDVATDTVYIIPTTGVPDDHDYNLRAITPLNISGNQYVTVKNIALANGDSGATGVLGIVDTQHWLVDNVVVKNGLYGVAVRIGSHYGEFRNSEILDCNNAFYAIYSEVEGVQTQSNNLHIHHNVVHNTGMVPQTVSGTDHHAFGFMGGDDITVEYNEVYEQSGSAITMFTWGRYSVVVGVNPNTANNYTVRYNFIHDINGIQPGSQGNLRGIDCSFTNDYYHPDDHKNWKIYGNVIARCSDSGIRMLGKNNNGTPQTEVYNNTVVDCGHAFEQHYGGAGIDDTFVDSGLVLKNNIFIDSKVYDPKPTNKPSNGYNFWGKTDTGIPATYGGDDFANNMYNPDGADLYYWANVLHANYAAYVAACGLETDSLIDNPEPVNKSGSTLADFSLQTGSPAIGAGVNVGIATDINGNPYASTPSLGAIEGNAVLSNLLPDQFTTLSSAFAIQNVDGDNDVTNGQTNVEINCLNAGAVEGIVELGGVVQSITTWTDTVVTIGTLDAGGLAPGQHDLVVLKPV